MNRTQSYLQIIDENSVSLLTEKTITKSFLDAWGGAFLSTIIYGLLLYVLLIYEDTTLAWGWRIIAVILFMLIPVVFIRSAVVNGRFVLGLSKQGFIYKVKKAGISMSSAPGIM